MYYAIANLDIYMSRDKKKLRKAAKKARFAVQNYGWIHSQAFANPQNWNEEFGRYSMLYDLDQGLLFNPDNFTVVRDI